MFSLKQRLPLPHPIWLLALQVAALWPMWQWYIRRLGDGSDEPWGLLALAAALLLACAERDNLTEEPRPLLLIAAGGLTVLGASVIPWVPALARAVLGVTALGLSFAALHNRSRSLLPLTALLLLSLPVISSLQFYLGYPLRAVTAWCSGGLLRSVGLAVEQTGATLTWRGRTVLVDAPCSGIHMLWVGMLLVALLSHLVRASAVRFTINAIAAFLIIIAGNVVRNSLLFIKEAGILSLPDWTHSVVGELMFLLVSLLIAGFVCRRRLDSSGVRCAHGSLSLGRLRLTRYAARLIAAIGRGRYSASH